MQESTDEKKSFDTDEKNDSHAASSAKSKIAKEQAVKILCFGDSLTEGYSPGYDFSPYSKALFEIINKKHEGLPCTITTAGESGELAMEMQERLKLVLYYYGGFYHQDKNKNNNINNNNNEINNKETIKHNFDFVIILGGTNDIGHGKSTDDISKALINLHEIVLKGNKNARTIAVTIPECKAQFEASDKKRNEINDRIQKFVNENKDKILFCDMFKEMPYHSLSKEDIKLLWNDGLHPTPKGYEKMANVIYNVIKDDLIKIHNRLKK